MSEMPKSFAKLAKEWRVEEKSMPNAHGIIIGRKAEELDALIAEWVALINAQPGNLRCVPLESRTGSMVSLTCDILGAEKR